MLKICCDVEGCKVEAPIESRLGHSRPRGWTVVSRMVARAVPGEDLGIKRVEDAAGVPVLPPPDFDVCEENIMCPDHSERALPKFKPQPVPPQLAGFLAGMGAA